MNNKRITRLITFFLLFIMLFNSFGTAYADTGLEKPIDPDRPVFNRRPLKHGPNANNDFQWSVPRDWTHDSNWEGRSGDKKKNGVRSPELTSYFEYEKRLGLLQQVHKGLAPTNPEFRVTIKTPNGETKVQEYRADNFGMNYKTQRRWNGYQSFRPIFHKLTKQDMSINNAFEEASEYLSDTWDQMLSSVQYDETTTYPVDTEFTFENISRPSKSVGEYKVDGKTRNNWQVYEMTPNFDRIKDSVLEKNPYTGFDHKPSQMPETITLKAVKPGYFGVYYNVSDNGQPYEYIKKKLEN